MKKIIVLLTIIVSVVSCKNDDDGAGLDPIIGTWKFTSATENGQALQLSACDEEDFFRFSESNTFTLEIHTDIPNNTQECQVEEFQGTWQKTNNTSYTIGDETITLSDAKTSFSRNIQGQLFVYTKQ